MLWSKRVREKRNFSFFTLTHLFQCFYNNAMISKKKKNISVPYGTKRSILQFLEAAFTNYFLDHLLFMHHEVVQKKVLWEKVWCLFTQNAILNYWLWFLKTFPIISVPFHIYSIKTNLSNLKGHHLSHFFRRWRTLYQTT